MDETPAPQAARPRTEPVALTLADLAALVAGCAVVLTIPWYYWPDPNDRLGPWPSWLPTLRLIRQVFDVSCLALASVVLARRGRYGGLARPAEFLGACCGLPALVWGVEVIVIRYWARLQNGMVVPGPGLRGMATSLDDQWRNGPRQTWEQGLFLAAVLAGVALFLGRARLPGWVRSAFLMVVWIGALEGGLAVLRWDVFVLIGRYRAAPLDVVSQIFLVSLPTKFFPQAFLYALPALAAIRSIRDPERRPTWLERTGLAVASLLFLVWFGSDRVHRYFGYGRNSPKIWITEELARTLAILLATALSAFLLRWVYPAWRRQTGPG